jgi:hypothetical protein
MRRIRGLVVSMALVLWAAMPVLTALADGALDSVYIEPEPGFLARVLAWFLSLI